MSNRRLPRGALIMPNEEPGAYLITLSGRAGHEPPTDPDGYEAFAAGLSHPIVRDWIAEALPQGPPVGFRNTANIRRRYERLRGRPAGLLVVGDAACTFNPVYAQGITVAAFGAQAVKDALARGERSTAHLQRLVAAAAEQAWAIAAGADKSLPRATGNAVRRSVVDRAAGWYVRRVEAHAACNPVVGQPFLEVLELVRPVRELFAWPVLRTVLFGRVRPPLTEPPLHPEPVSSPCLPPSTSSADACGQPFSRTRTSPPASP
jgi:2-polyprenyl-6-methoxyphenol hydroxylase-like FAD-dependent oxidoreductase